MRMPACFDLEIYRGDTGTWAFLLWKDVLKTVPVDLTGVTPKAQMRAGPNGAVLAEFTCTVTAPNRIDMVLTPAASAALGPLRAPWDLQLTYSSGNVSTVLAGRASVVADVTRSAA
jgi:hypothetical protein